MITLKRIKKVLTNTPTYWLAIGFLTFLIMLSLAAPFIPIDPNKTDVSNMSAMPSLAHLFGTDEVGRDYFIRVVHGGRISLLVGILAMIASTFIGTVIGLVSGYFGGIVDGVFMRIVDVLSSIPWMVLVIVLSVFMKPGLITIIIVIGCFSWMSTARLVRAETLSAKEREYVVYSNFIGIKPLTIITRHILPNVLPTLIIAATMNISGAIMTESALSFLGVGIQQPMASWGSLLQNAQSSLQRAPHMAVLPGLFIIFTVYSFNTLGNFLRDIASVEEA
ncbi:ABC transporter permease [Vagococcus xieshaowenii]|uniref:ABC transporter permease n=1 Tax=Vagococcus xieshaowenii TaxID=2562451 RepID=A0AAJ5JLA1_9ENTE|nr:ABC transporter permease [Vagococcus xieshaowenii]QCA28003.1 ABC transporter permease [Vagococcus xieshaowenii]TFZ41230.1 ABC transporter permease [Vagococcus xieshaowenii]